MPSTNNQGAKVNDILVEKSEKESLIRVKWVQRHAEYFGKAAQLNREEKKYTLEDIAQSVIEAGMATTKRDHVTAGRFRATKSVPDYVSANIKSDERKEPEVMKPPPTVVKDSLAESRKEYLRGRNLLKPEDKYNLLLCSNWEYGWKIGETKLKMSGSEHGRMDHSLRSFRSRVGPQRDPDHYKSADTTSYTICSTL